MDGIESDVLVTFMGHLTEAKDVPAAVAAELGIMLAQEKLPKPDELVELYSAASGDPLA